MAVIALDIRLCLIVNFKIAKSAIETSTSGVTLDILRES